MTDNEKLKKGDCVEVEYTGYSNEQIFDSNIESDLKTLDSNAKPEKTVVIVGQKMMVSGLDKALEGKELGKEYSVEISPKEGFGERNRNFIKTMPMKLFTEQKMMPQAGMVLTLNNSLVKIIAVSGARVSVDFNHPLAGKPLRYKFKILRRVTSDKEKLQALFKFHLQFVPEIEEKEKLLVRAPKFLEPIVADFAKRFKDFLSKEISFEIKEEKKEHEEIAPRN